MGPLRRRMFEAAWADSFKSRFFRIAVEAGALFAVLGFVYDSPTPQGIGNRIAAALVFGVLFGVLFGVVFGVLLGLMAGKKWPRRRSLSYSDRLLVVRSVGRGEPVVAPHLATDVIEFADVVRTIARKNLRPINSILPVATLLLFGALVGGILATAGGRARDAAIWFGLTVLVAALTFGARNNWRRDINNADRAEAHARRMLADDLDS